MCFVYQSDSFYKFDQIIYISLNFNALLSSTMSSHVHVQFNRTTYSIKHNLALDKWTFVYRVLYPLIPIEITHACDSLQTNRLTDFVANKRSDNGSCKKQNFARTVLMLSLSDGITASPLTVGVEFRASLP